MFFSIMTSFVSGGFLVYSFDYLTRKPHYLCEWVPGSGVYEKCTNDDVCENISWMKYEIDWSNRESMHNWVDTLDLTCKLFYFKNFRCV